jgi:hypothetical protein
MLTNFLFWLSDVFWSVSRAADRASMWLHWKADGSPQ